jgi:transposase-like protein
VSRRFVELSQQQLHEWLTRRLDELDLAVVMIDGIHFRERVILVALGIDAQGTKLVLGLREGSSEATRVVASLLADLVDRGLDAARMTLWVIDGGKALRKAIVTTFGAKAMIQRCQVHKCRNVLEHLPQEQHASVHRALRDAWATADAKLAGRRLHNLAGSLQSQAARVRADEVAAGRVGPARSRCRRTLEQKGRVASRTRSCRLGAFNKERDNAPNLFHIT